MNRTEEEERQLPSDHRAAWRCVLSIGLGELMCFDALRTACEAYGDNTDVIESHLLPYLSEGGDKNGTP